MLKNLKSKTIILASKSPRRQELLKGLDVTFETRTKDVEESYPDSLAPEDVPAFLSEKKANAFISELKENEIIITADTIVIQDTQILEKPKSANEAKEMISLLSNNTHTVVTGVSVQSLNKKVVFSDTTSVTFGEISTEEIEYYIEKYKPFDKAGSYGVQEWIGYIGIEKLSGSYCNVMGLPVHKLYSILKEF